MSTAYELAALAEQEQELMIEAVRLMSEGRKPAFIKNQTGLTSLQQRRAKEDFDRMVARDDYMQHRAKVAVGEIDNHYTNLIRKFYSAHDDAVAADDYKSQANILKQIADVEKNRTDFLHRAGLLGAQGVGDSIADAEEKISAVKEILKEVARLHPDAAKTISEKIGALDGTVVATRYAEHEGEKEQKRREVDVEN